MWGTSPRIYDKPRASLYPVPEFYLDVVFWLNQAGSLLSGSPHQTARWGIQWFTWREQGKDPNPFKPCPWILVHAWVVKHSSLFFPTPEQHIPLRLTADPRLQSGEIATSPFSLRKGIMSKGCFSPNDKDPPNPSFHGREFWMELERQRYYRSSHKLQK